MSSENPWGPAGMTTHSRQDSVTAKMELARSTILDLPVAHSFDSFESHPVKWVPPVNPVTDSTENVSDSVTQEVYETTHDSVNTAFSETMESHHPSTAIRV